MRTRKLGLAGAVLAAALLALPLGTATAAPAASAAPPAEGEAAGSFGSDNLPNPFEDKRYELRQEALDLVLSGEAQVEQRGPSTVVNVGSAPAENSSRAAIRANEGVAPREDQYVELERETTDRIFVVLAEFGDERHPLYPDQDTNPTIPGPARFDGPLHNQIPEPDRSYDNRVIWQPDYSQQHYEDLYFSQEEGFESLANYYERQSSGRYSVEGTVTDWVRVRYNEARYGRSNDDPNDANGDDPAVCGSQVCNTTWNLVDDAVDQWVADQEAAGRTQEEITAELQSFDQWDRYDYDADGNFNERDGYIDHFQIVHAGGDQADADPWQGEDAIWSHRWYAFITDRGITGPEFNLRGGAEIGDTGVWAGDYTIQPENGGISVFAHEYGHDLGLPDLYDTASGSSDQVGWWSIMAQSRLSAEGDQGIGTRAGDLGPWEKLQLGWLDYEVAVAGQDRRYLLGPHEFNTDNPQALVVVLPDKDVTTEFGAPFAGESQWWSGSDDDLDNSMTRTIDLETATASAAVTLQARYDIEEDFDFLYFQASADGGETWTSLDGTVGGEPFPRDTAGVPALTGTSDGWVPVEVPLDAYLGQTIQFRIRYVTDGGVAPIGFFADDITVTVDGQTVFTDGGEDGDNGWTLDGFRAVGASETQTYEHYYLASNREYISYDRYLRTGPYNFGWLNTQPLRVEHFPYQDGLLVWYWDTEYDDNNTSEHPGHGEIMPIDAHPELLYNLTGAPWRGRVQLYDATFGRQRADSFFLHLNGERHWVRGQAARPTFDDTRTYWYPELPTHGVILPGYGVGLRVVAEEGNNVRVRLFDSTPEE